jgi:hypothetical protein
MKTEDKDTMRNLFAQLPDEQLPCDFNRKMMEKVNREAARNKKIAAIKDILGYVLCGVIMTAACVLVLHFTGFSLKLPDIQFCDRPFETPDFGVLKSPAFLFGFYIGLLAFLLLVADSMLRRHFHK